jgi:hypothetical protein
MGTRKMALSGEILRMVSDIKLGDNIIISVIPRTKRDEEGDPFRPSRKIQRSPTTGGRADVEVVEESEGCYVFRHSDHSTPVVARRGAPGKQLARNRPAAFHGEKRQGETDKSSNGK